MVDSVARWHIDVIMSLIRLIKHLTPELSIEEIYSDIEKEAYTYSINYYEKAGLIILDNYVIKPEAHIKGRYIISSDVQKELDNANFGGICDKIFNNLSLV